MKRDECKRFAVFFISSLFIFSSSLLIGFPEDIPRPPSTAKGILFQGTTYAAYSGTEKLWEMRADHIEGTRERAKASQVHATLYRKGKVRYHLKSKTAFINSTTTDVFFPEGAVFNSPSGEEVRVRLLLWKAREKKFFGTKGVRVRHWNTLVQGDRMVLDQSYTSIKIDGHVKSQVVP